MRSLLNTELLPAFNQLKPEIQTQIKTKYFYYTEVETISRNNRFLTN